MTQDEKRECKQRLSDLYGRVAKATLMPESRKSCLSVFAGARAALKADELDAFNDAMRQVLLILDRDVVARAESMP